MADEVVIVGGGFSGLAAGVALAEAGRPVRLLEQKPYLGGRARSFVDPATGSVVDNGQHLIMGCYHATRRFLAAIGTLDRVAFQPGLRVAFIEPGRGVTTLDCPRWPAPWHLLLGIFASDSFSAGEKLEVALLGRRLARPPESDRSTRRDDGLPAQAGRRWTVEDWLASLGQSERVRRNFWDLLCIAAMNEDPQRASAALFERVLRLALFQSPEDSCLGIPRVGLSECYTQAASDFITARGGRVEVGRSVSNLLVRPDGAGGSAGVSEGVVLADGERIEARVVLSAVPWHAFLQLLPEKLVSAEPFFSKIGILRPAPIISIYLWFDRPVTDLDFVGLRRTTVQWLFDKSRVVGSSGHLVSLVLSGAHKHVDRSKEELLDVASEDLARLFPRVRSAKIAHSLVIKERLATFSPTVESQEGRPTARTPVRGLYLAGDWTDTGLPATIEGAVQSGYTAAAEILSAI
jgi:hydroxysqualene dehydroxylase